MYLTITHCPPLKLSQQTSLDYMKAVVSEMFSFGDRDILDNV